MKRIFDRDITSGKSKNWYKAGTFWTVKENQVNDSSYIRLDDKKRYLPGDLHNLYTEYESLYNILLKAGGIDQTQYLVAYKTIKSSNWNHKSIVNDLKDNASSFSYSEVGNTQKDPLVITSTQAHGSLNPMQDFSFVRCVQIGAFIFCFKIIIWRYRYLYYYDSVQDDVTQRSPRVGLYVANPSDCIISDGAAFPKRYHYFTSFMIVDVKGNTIYDSKTYPRSIGHNIFPFRVEEREPPETAANWPSDILDLYRMRIIKMRIIVTELTIAFLWSRTAKGQIDTDKFLIIGRANHYDTLMLLFFTPIKYTWRSGVNYSTINTATDYIPQYAFADNTGIVGQYYNQYNEIDVTKFIHDDHMLIDISSGQYSHIKGYTSIDGTYIANTFTLDQTGFEYYNSNYGLCIPLIYMKDDKPIVFEELYLARFTRELKRQKENGLLTYAGKGLKVDRGKFLYLGGAEHDEAPQTAAKSIWLKTADVEVEEPPEMEAFDWLAGMDQEDPLEVEWTLWKKYTGTEIENKIDGEWGGIKIICHDDPTLFKIIDYFDLVDGSNYISLVGAYYDEANTPIYLRQKDYVFDVVYDESTMCVTSISLLIYRITSFERRRYNNQPIVQNMTDSASWSLYYK